MLYNTPQNLQGKTEKNTVDPSGHTSDGTNQKPKKPTTK